jgi:protein SCO1
MCTQLTQLCFSFSTTPGRVADVTFRLRFRCAAAVLLALTAACRAQPGHREYPVSGQLIVVDVNRQQVTLKHGDIPGFMPAMTMVYQVKDTGIASMAAGDLVNARLILAEGEMPYLVNVKRTGHAELPSDAKGVMDPMVLGDVVPDDELKDQDGAPRRLSEWKNHALAVTFIYTSCPMPDFCPLMDRKFAALQERIAGDPSLRDAAHLVSISFDPEHDTPAVLKTHAARAGANPRYWSFLTGTPDAMARVTSRFAVSASREPDSPTIVHNLRTAVIDRSGRLTATYNGSDWTIDTLVNDLRNASRR